MNVRERIRQHIRDTHFVADEEFSDDDQLLGIVDSLGMMELVAMLDSEFGVHVGRREFLPSNLGTVARVVAFVESRLPKPGPRPAADSAPICCSSPQEDP